MRHHNAGNPGNAALFQSWAEFLEDFLRAVRILKADERNRIRVSESRADIRHRPFRIAPIVANLHLNLPAGDAPSLIDARLFAFCEFFDRLAVVRIAEIVPGTGEDCDLERRPPEAERLRRVRRRFCRQKGERQQRREDNHKPSKSATLRGGRGPGSFQARTHVELPAHFPSLTGTLRLGANYGACVPNFPRGGKGTLKKSLASASANQAPHFLHEWAIQLCRRARVIYVANLRPEFVHDLLRAMTQARSW